MMIGSHTGRGGMPQAGGLGGVLGAALLLCAGSVHAQMAIEISKDGHAWAAPGFAPATGWVARGSSVPFGTQPNVTVQLRRQVGGLAIADVNGDGHNDIIAVCYISQSFPPYEN